MSECERVISEKYRLLGPGPGPESSHPAGTLRGGAGRSVDSCCTGRDRIDGCCGRAGDCAAAVAAVEVAAGVAAGVAVAVVAGEGAGAGTDGVAGDEELVE